MDLYLQVGYGMIGHASALLSDWGGGCVILSPRDVAPDKLKGHAKRLTDVGGRVLIDPQCYKRDATHGRLVSYDYWPKPPRSLWEPPEWSATIQRLAAVNAECGTGGFIVPSSLCDRVTKDWLEDQHRNISEAAATAGGRDVIATIALSDDVVKDSSQVEMIAESLPELECSACYLVAELPDPPYLTREPLWIVNMLDLIAQIRLSGREAVVGYSNHQMLIAAAAGATAIAAGTWLNLRHFDVSRYFDTGEDSASKRVPWFYSASCLSEFKISTLDLAQRQGSLAMLRQSTPYSEVLFSSPRPTSAGFNEGDSFRHYLTALRQQALSARQATFESTADWYESMLDSADSRIQALARQGILDRARTFRDCVEPHKQALTAHRATSGPLLSRCWSDLA